MRAEPEFKIEQDTQCLYECCQRQQQDGKGLSVIVEIIEKQSQQQDSSRHAYSGRYGNTVGVTDQQLCLDCFTGQADHRCAVFLYSCIGGGRDGQSLSAIALIFAKAVILL